MPKDPLETACSILADGDGDAIVDLGFGEARLYRQTRPTAVEGTVYRPLVCVVLQGAKDVQAGELSVACPRGHAIVVSHDLPVLSRITRASPGSPYIAFILPLDLAVLRGFYEQMPEFRDPGAPNGALAAYPAEPELLDVIARLLALVPEDRTAPVLAPILIREIHARLLLSPQSTILRRFLWRDDPSNHVARAIASIRSSIHRPLSVTALAERAGMSKSSFHAHFKAVTGLSPGQYQKDMRLLEARRLIVESDLAISSVAFEVGYESPAQFSRDYSRKFGVAPRNDRKGETAVPEFSNAGALHPV
jgi:AraC-like DNA-binding protein